MERTVPAAGWLLGVLALAGCGDDPAPATVAPVAPAPVAPAPADPGDDEPPPLPEFWVHAETDGHEVIVLVARPPWGLPAEGVPVRIGKVHTQGSESAVTGDDGTARIQVPAALRHGLDAITASPVIEVDGVGIHPHRGHTSRPANEQPLLVVPETPHPGDEVEVLAWAPGIEAAAGLEGDLTLDGDFPWSQRFRSKGADVLPGWIRRTTSIPDEAPPGPFTIRLGDMEVASTVVSRIPPRRKDTSTSGPGGPVLVPSGPSAIPDGGLTIEPDGPTWTIAHPQAEQGALVVLLAEVDGRFAGMATATAHGESTNLRLAVPDESREAVLTAAVAGPDGWLTGHRRLDEWGHAATALRLEADLTDDGRLTVQIEAAEAAAFAVAVESPTVRRTAFSGPGTRFARSLPGPWTGSTVRIRGVAWFPSRAVAREVRSDIVIPGAPPPQEPSYRREGDRYQGSGSPPVVEFRWDRRQVLRTDHPWPTKPASFLRTAERVFMTVLDGTPGKAIRLKSDAEIVGEFLVHQPMSTEMLYLGGLEGAAISVETSSDKPATVILAAPETDPPETLEPLAEGAGLRRSMPRAIGANEPFTIVLDLEIPESATSAVFVFCPLPAGAVLDEDLYRTRERGPDGAHLDLDRGSVMWQWRSLPAGRHRVELHLRARWTGDFVVPPAKLEAGGPTGPRARSAGARLVIE